MKVVLLLLGIFIASVVKCQVLEGVVSDADGQAVEGATVYVRETAQGCVADENGNFRIALPSGTYVCEVSALGYEKQTLQVRVGEKRDVLRVVLKPMVYMLQEAKVNARGEDPAFYIMRHAIARAPYHRHQVKRYLSEVYTKGTMQLEKVPKLLMLSKEIRKEVTPYLGKVFTLESVMEVAFEAPDTYERKIVAFSSSIPDDLSPDEALGIVTASVYDPDVMGMVSPLAPGAFSYYRFRFAECYLEDGKTINKIRVEPRKKNSQLLDGYIYIVENDWSVVNFDFSAKLTGVTLHIKGVFHDVKPSVFLPTSYDIDVDVKIFGVKASGKYYASVKYKEVEADTTHGVVVKPVSVVAENKALPEPAKSPKREKAERKLEALLEKEELTTRDAYRMACLSQQLMTPERPDTIPPLEIREEIVTEKVSVDSMAVRRDSAYWLQMRTIPLKQEEVKGYQMRDSLRAVVKKSEGETDTTRRAHRDVFGQILWGSSYKLGKQGRFEFDGLVKAFPEYNFVDGFWIGQRFGVSLAVARGQRLYVEPSVYYATARKSWIWQVYSSYTYAPLKRGLLKVRFGDVSADYKGNAGAWRLENTLTSLVCADNFMKFYGKRYVALENRIDISNGLVLSVGGNYEKRRVLENHISYNIYKKDPKPNTPSSEGGVDMPDNTALHVYGQLDYTPRSFYRLRNGYKRYVRSDWPTFSVRYDRGISVGSGLSSAYNRIAIGVQQKKSLGLFDKISYKVQAGKFFSVKELYFPDYKQFGATGWVFSKEMFFSDFYLTDYYELATAEKWFQGALNYTSSYLLIKRLSFMQRFLFNEAVHVRYVWMPETKSYTECGYSLGFEDEIRGGVFFGFDREGYRGVGVRVVLPLDWK